MFKKRTGETWNRQYPPNKWKPSYAICITIHSRFWDRMSWKSTVTKTGWCEPLCRTRLKYIYSIRRLAKNTRCDPHITSIFSKSFCLGLKRFLCISIESWPQMVMSALFTILISFCHRWVNWIYIFSGRAIIRRFTKSLAPTRWRSTALKECISRCGHLTRAM